MRLIRKVIIQRIFLLVELVCEGFWPTPVRGVTRISRMPAATSCHQTIRIIGHFTNEAVTYYSLAKRPKHRQCRISRTENPYTRLHKVTFMYWGVRIFSTRSALTLRLWQPIVNLSLLPYVSNGLGPRFVTSFIALCRLGKLSGLCLIPITPSPPMCAYNVWSFDLHRIYTSTWILQKPTWGIVLTPHVLHLA